MAETNRTHHTTTSAPGDADLRPIVSLGEAQTPSRADIMARCTSAPTAREQRRWLVIGMLADHTPLAEIMAATGYRPRTIREIAQRYHALGAAALEDRRAHGQGAPPLIAAALRHELWQALQSPAPDGGDWTGPKVARWIAAKTGRRIHRQRGWEYLRRLVGAPEPACAESRTASQEPRTDLR